MMLISHKMEGIFSSFHTFVATELEREEIATFIHDTTIQKVIYYKKQLYHDLLEGCTLCLALTIY